MTKYDYVKTRREDVAEIPGKWVWVVRAGTKIYTRFNVWIFKISGGRLMKYFRGRYPVCLVTMTGARSGKKREVPLIDIPVGENQILVGSQGGLNMQPGWYYNLKANPEVRIMAGGVSRSYMARQISDEEKRGLWPHITGIYPDFDEYQARTDRNIPVFVCRPKER